MVESANKYLRASEILFRTDRNLLHVASINAAIGLEILLKSFGANVTENEGTVFQNYEPNTPAIREAHKVLVASGDAEERLNFHDLLILYFAIPEPVRRAVNLHRFERTIRHCRHLFAGSRYEYEAKPEKAWKGADDSAIQALGDLVPNVVIYCQQQGCTDPWILTYSDA
ncbi:hypothetical protein D3C76_444660 [compost metagenome]|jgi:hypothetical protein